MEPESISAAIDSDVADIVLASIRRHSMHIDQWRWTKVGKIHQELDSVVQLLEAELPLVSYYASHASWYVVSTRRVLWCFRGATHAIPAHQISESKFGNFKGHGGLEREIMVLVIADGRKLELEYETGYASMGAIYGIDVLRRKIASIHRTANQGG